MSVYNCHECSDTGEIKAHDGMRFDEYCTCSHGISLGKIEADPLPQPNWAAISDRMMDEHDAKMSARGMRRCKDVQCATWIQSSEEYCAPCHDERFR